MDDTTSTQFLQRLYRTELAGAPSVAAAVREAARDLRGEHPYFWAPFGVFGMQGRQG